ncbi:MAG: hypothetical protein WBG95_11315 [Sulfitobacter sp.]
MMESLVAEAPWMHLLITTQKTRTRFFNGLENPSVNVAAIAEYRRQYPWIEIEIVKNSGQILNFQHYRTIISILVNAAPPV